MAQNRHDPLWKVHILTSGQQSHKAQTLSPDLTLRSPYSYHKEIGHFLLKENGEKGC